MANVDKNKQIPKYSQNISDLAKTADESVGYARTAEERHNAILESRLAAAEERLKAAEQRAERIVPKGFIFGILLCAALLLPSCKVVNAAHDAAKKEKANNYRSILDKDFERKASIGGKKGGRND